MKKCTTCEIEKKESEFSKAKANKDGLRGNCKSCVKEESKKYRKANEKKIKQFKKEWYQQNKDKILENKKKYCVKNKEQIKEYGKLYYLENKNFIREKNKEYRKKNKEYHTEYGKQYYENNKQKLKEYRENNQERIKYFRENYKERKNKLRRDKRKVDPLYKMKDNLRARTRSAFKNKRYYKTSKTQEMLGVDWEVCKAHIERQFTKDMNWSNYGEWHIDHIIPLASASTEEELKKLCHYSNLQPLWAFDNLIKSAKINGQQNKFRF
tara:strand:+ start:4398 stop:5198 length:801 start_codon:yes stop_codon:yes gene_type:complete